jgi:uncharacterized protein Usg
MDNKGMNLDLETDVISQKSNQQKMSLPDFFTLGALLEYWQRQTGGPLKNFFLNGLECKVLQPGKGWQTGKMKIHIEFYPDRPTEPDSPLDEIRKMDSYTEPESPLDEIRNMASYIEENQAKMSEKDDDVPGRKRRFRKKLG